MNNSVAAIGQDGHFRVRPAILIGCAILFAAVVIPRWFSHRYYEQICLLLAATLCIASGWLLLVRYRELETTWRGWIAVFTAVYLTASVPGFFIEFSRISWFMHAHWASLYVRPWVHWGFIFVYLSVAGSFAGRAKSRVMFVLASVLLMILWESMRPWIY